MIELDSNIGKKAGVRNSRPRQFCGFCDYWRLADTFVQCFFYKTKMP